MKKEEKGVVIDQLVETLDQYDHFYITDAGELNAADTATLRRSCYKDGIKLMVVKNSLFKRALENKDADKFAPLFDSLVGNSAIMFSSTGNAPAKVIKAVSAKNAAGKPVLKAAYVEESFYGADQLEALVSIKSKNELIADVIALLQSPAKNVVSALQSSSNTITGVLKTLSQRPE